MYKSVLSSRTSLTQQEARFSSVKLPWFRNTGYFYFVTYNSMILHKLDAHRYYERADFRYYDGQCSCFLGLANSKRSRP